MRKARLLAAGLAIAPGGCSSERCILPRRSRPSPARLYHERTFEHSQPPASINCATMDHTKHHLMNDNLRAIRDAAGLRSYMRELRSTTHSFAQAVYAHHNPPSDPDTTATNTRTGTPFLTVTRASTPNFRNPLSRAGQLEAASAPADRRELHLKLEEYAKRMAEAALTRNGRELKAKATTKVCRCTVLSASSVWTRPCVEILREVVAELG